MSTGVFADRASKNHIKQTTKQKKVVFGERPANISSHSLKFGQLSTSSSLHGSNPEQELGKVSPEVPKPSTSNIVSPVPDSAPQGRLKSLIQKSSILSKFTDPGQNQEKSKGTGIPWYIVT
jgi:hypothetical protein